MSSGISSATSNPWMDSVRPSSSFSAESIFNSVTAGYVAGVCGVLVGHPLDSVKVLLQTNPGGGMPSGSTTATMANTANAPVASGTNTRGLLPTSMAVSQQGSSANMSTIAQTTDTRWRTESTGRSMRALYAGMTGPLLTVGLLQSTYFAIYDSLRRVLHRYDFPGASDNDYLYNDSLRNVVYASAFAGSATTVLTSPLMVVKTKQQIMVWGFRKAIIETMKTKSNKSLQSWRNFYVGFGPHFVAVTFGRSLYMTVYEALKRTLVERKRNSASWSESTESFNVTTQERIFSAAVAGMVCWAGIFPLDAIQNKMYQQALHNGKKTSLEMAREMYYSSGKSVRPFFRGFSLTVLRAGPVAAVVLPVYDMALEWLAER